MNSLQSSLYTVAVAVCVFSTGILRDKKTRFGGTLAYVTAFLVIETLGFVLELLMAHPAVPLKALWLGLRMATSLLTAPCLWLAIRESVEGVRPRIFSLPRGHLFAVIAGIGLTVPLIGSAHLGFDYIDPLHRVSPLHSRVIHGTMLLCIAIFAGQAPFYLWRCRRMLTLPTTSEGAAFPTIGTRSRAWLQFPLIIVLTSWLLGLVRTLYCISHAPPGFGVLFALTDVSVTVASLYAIIQRTSHAQFPAPATSSLVPVETHSPSLNRAPPIAAEVVAKNPTPAEIPGTDRLATNSAVAKYTRSPLNAPTRDRIKRKLARSMADEKLYCDSLLSLRSLSSAIKEDARYVSQVINQDLGSNFYELVSRHRIEGAKALLQSFPDRTILEIALAVGFNSKSTFNDAFRRNTGTTPREFRARF